MEFEGPRRRAWVEKQTFFILYMVGVNEFANVSEANSVRMLGDAKEET